MDLIDGSVECHVCRPVRCGVADGEFAVPVRRCDESVQGCLTEGWTSGVLGEELYPVCAACDDRRHCLGTCSGEETRPMVGKPGSNACGLLEAAAG